MFAHIILRDPHPQTGSQLAMGSGHSLTVSPKENEGFLERIIWEASRGAMREKRQGQVKFYLRPLYEPSFHIFDYSVRVP